MYKTKQKLTQRYYLLQLTMITIKIVTVGNSRHSGGFGVKIVRDTIVK